MRTVVLPFGKACLLYLVGFKWWNPLGHGSVSHGAFPCGGFPVGLEVSTYTMLLWYSIVNVHPFPHLNFCFIPLPSLLLYFPLLLSPPSLVPSPVATL